MTEAFTKHAGLCPNVLVTLGLYPSIEYGLFLAGEFGIKNVLFEEAEATDAGVRVRELDKAAVAGLLLELPPNIE